MRRTMIEVDGLTKHFGAVQALRGVSFAIEGGQVVGLLGPNGAGKTTAMRILTGYLAPTEGTARVDGRDVVEDAPECRRRIGYLPEGNPLYGELRVDEALAFMARLHQIRGPDRAVAVDRSVEVAGLRGYERRVVGTLSKGLRQRVGLAQALMHEPDVLVLDEPTSGLDPNQQEDMRRLIRTLGAERTVLLSTHILPEVEAVCGRALIIDQGQLVADDAVEAIKRQQSGGSAAHATVRGPEATIRRALAFGGPALAVVPVPGREGTWDVRVPLEDGDERERMEQVAAALVGAGLALSQLTAETATLEQIFARLTRGSGSAGGADVPPVLGTEEVRS